MQIFVYKQNVNTHACAKVEQYSALGRMCFTLITHDEILMTMVMFRNYSETSMISIPADKNNKAIILDVGGKKHKIRGKSISTRELKRCY